MIFRIIIIQSLVWISALITSTGAYSHGAPAKSCQTLYPGHGVDKQYGVAPYEIVSSEGPAGNVIVSIVAKGLPFAGFMIQSRLGNDREMIVNGRFSEDKHTQTKNCNGDNQNTLTQRSGTPKYKIEASWTPPKGFVGNVIFRATVVQSKSVFWTTLDSQPIHVSTHVNPKPNLAYNRHGIEEDSSHNKQIDNIQSSSIPQTQSTYESQSRINYEICDKKFCFGLPLNCMKFRTCNMLLAGGYVPRGDGLVEFEIYADVNKYNGNSYYSMGLSSDNKMGDDSVTDCIISSGRPQLKNSVNIGRSNEYLSPNEYHGVSALNTTYSDGILYCKWRRRRRSTIRGNAYDLKDKKYYIVLAFGLLAGNEEKEFHTDRLASEQVVDIKVIGHVTAQSKAFLIKLHGSFMIIAWLGCVSIAILIARYFKRSWPTETLFGVQIWFAAHRSLMLSALILILISSISAWIYVGTFQVGSHQLFGLAAILIAVANPIGAIFRPLPDSSKRWIFNWIHFSLGNIGHICAIIALFLAYNLTVNQLSPIYLWILIIYLLFHITSHLLLQMNSCDCRNSSKTSDISLRDIHNKNNNNMENITKTSFLQFFLFFYIIVNVILIIALIVCVYIPQSSVSSFTKN